MNWNLSKEERIKLIHLSERLSNIKDHAVDLYMAELPNYQKAEIRRIYNIAKRIQEELDSIIY